MRRIIERPALAPAVWSPDGGRIVYSADGRLYVADLEGNARDIGGAEVATALSWSAPLNWLALIDRGAVVTLRPDGSDRRRVDLPGMAVALAWAPGSDRLAVAVRHEDNEAAGTELWLVSRDGGFRRMVMSAPAGHAIRDLQWFADSLYLFYGVAAQDDAPVTQVWRVRISYPDRRQLPVAAPMAVLRLAPSGRELAYVIGPNVAAGRGQVMVVRLDGSRSRTLTDVARIAGLAWSPQSDKLAYAELGDEADAELWIADGDGSGRLHLHSYLLEFADPEIALSMSWAPDGRHLVFGTNTGSFVGPIWLAMLQRR